MTRRRAPMATVTLVLSALVVALVPALQRWLVLDRAAVGAGQLWRVATGSLVHFSPSHLVLDVVAVAVPGLLLELGGRRIGGTIAAAAIAVALAVLAFDPRIAVYGGLSGIAYALVVLYGLEGTRAQGVARIAALAVVALTMAKLTWEMWSGAVLLVGGEGFAPVPVSHIAGSCVGVTAFVWDRLRATVTARGFGNSFLDTKVPKEHEARCCCKPS